MKIVYGPVHSWRLGHSLGIDMISTGKKVCSYDCVYCQLGRTVEHTVERREFVTLQRLREELEAALNEVKPDVITFSGTGEPTIASNITDAVNLVREVTKIPIAILTNSYQINDSDVRRALLSMDIVVAKLDAPNQTLFEIINRPVPNITLKELVEGIKSFKKKFKGKLSLQMMFIEDNKNHAQEMAKIAEYIDPDEVQLNTPLRKNIKRPLMPDDMERIKKYFNKLHAISVYDAREEDVKALDIGEVEYRRPGSISK